MEHHETQLLSLPLVDEQVIHRLCSDTSQETVIAIINMFIPELDGFQEQIAQWQPDSNDFRDLHDCAHLCKSAAAYCGAERLRQFCQNLEHACNTTNANQINSLLLLKDTLINESRSALQLYLDKTTS